MLAYVHCFLAGTFKSPYAYGMSRILIGIPSIYTITQFGGRQLYEASLFVILVSLYWLWRIVKIAEARTIAHTRKVLWAEVLMICQHHHGSSVELLQSMQRAGLLSVSPAPVTRQP